MHRLSFLGALVVVGALHPAAAAAQGALVHAAAAAALTDGNTGAAFGGGVTYRFNRVLGIGVELTGIQNLDNFAFVFEPRLPGPAGHAIVYTTNVRIEIPTTLQRVIPYVIGGGGVASMTRSYPIVYATLARLDLQVLPGPPTISGTTVNMALTLGGGGSFLITEHVSIDADLRVLRLAGDGTRNIGRFGGGVSYRF